jgi:hypothetical protein
VAIDRRHIGFQLSPFTVQVTPERIRAFAEAIGLPAGEHDDIAPPTYMKVIEGDGNSSRTIVAALQIDLRRILHVEQEFHYTAPIRAGDVLRVDRKVSDISTKKGGALESVVIDSTMHNDAGVCVGTSRQTLLVRNEPDGSTG